MPPTADPVQLPPLWKRPIPLIIASAAAIAFAMFLYDRLQPRYLIVAGPLSGSHAAGLSGQFHIEKAPRTGLRSAIGIPSNQVAGACIIFRAQDLGYSKMAEINSCSKNSDCYTDELPADNPTASAYCHANSCWAKPPNLNQFLCNTGGTRQLNQHYDVPASPPTRQLPVEAGSKARLVACLNKKGAVADKTGCATKDGPDRLEVFGPEFPIN